MKYKYRVIHNVPIDKYINLKINSFASNVFSPFVKPIKKNIGSVFVIGCGHSGTTLVNARIGQHSSVYAIGRESTIFAQPSSLRCSKAIYNEWIYNALSLKKSIVMEKTPKHIHSIQRIKKILPNAKFIIVIRNPLDNCASLYKRFGDLKFAVERWLIDNKEIPKYANDLSVKIIKYENLTNNPYEVFNEICHFLNIEWEDKILSASETIYDKSLLEGNMSLRREQVKKPIKPNINSWEKVFTQEEAEFVKKQTLKLAIKIGYKDNLYIGEK